MKWGIHKAITKAVCSRLNVQPIRDVVGASVLPDVEPDYTYRVRGRRRVRVSRVRVAHHGSEALNLAFEYLKKARKAYMKGNVKYAEHLGRALHYLQDYSVDPRKKLWIFEYRSERAHKEREELLAAIHVPEEAISKGLSEVCTPSRVRRVIREAKPKKVPEEILFQATYLSTVAAKLVLKPDKPQNLEEKYRRALKTHIVLVSLPLLTLLAGITAPTLMLTVALSLALHMLDFNYHKWKLEHEWFKA